MSQHEFERGDVVLDRSDDEESELVVVERHDERADERELYTEPSGRVVTVHDWDSEYPPEDLVISCVYRNSVREYESDVDSTVRGILDAHSNGVFEDSRAKIYDFHESRLVEVGEAYA